MHCMQVYNIMYVRMCMSVPTVWVSVCCDVCVCVCVCVYVCVCVGVCVL